MLEAGHVFTPFALSISIYMSTFFRAQVWWNVPYTTIGVFFDSLQRKEKNFAFLALVHIPHLCPYFFSILSCICSIVIRIPPNQDNFLKIHAPQHKSIIPAYRVPGAFPAHIVGIFWFGMASWCTFPARMLSIFSIRSRGGMNIYQYSLLLSYSPRYNIGVLIIFAPLSIAYFFFQFAGQVMWDADIMTTSIIREHSFSFTSS